MAALQYLRLQPDIQPDKVGLWGVSQGGWIIAMAAAGHPQDVAFIISVSGSGVPVAEQQVFSIEAQSQAAGFSEQDISKAALLSRLLIDWQISNPIYQEVNVAAAQALGDGPWNSFMTLVYESGDITPAEGLQQGIEIMKSIKDESWAEFLYINELYLPQMESIPPEQMAVLRSVVEPTLLNDPKEYLTRVRCPVVAFFGQKDVLQPTERSAILYEQYLSDAGNDNCKIVVIPGVGHSISVSTSAYWDALSDRLDDLYAE